MLSVGPLFYADASGHRKNSPGNSAFATGKTPPPALSRG